MAAPLNDLSEKSKNTSKSYRSKVMIFQELKRPKTTKFTWSAYKYLSNKLTIWPETHMIIIMLLDRWVSRYLLYVLLKSLQPCWLPPLSRRKFKKTYLHISKLVHKQQAWLTIALHVASYIIWKRLKRFRVICKTIIRIR